MKKRNEKSLKERLPEKPEQTAVTQVKSNSEFPEETVQEIEVRAQTTTVVLQRILDFPVRTHGH